MFQNPPEPDEIKAWSKEATPSLNVTVARDVQDMERQGVKPDDVDCLVLWMVFRDAVKQFLAACSEKKRLKVIQCSYAGVDLVLCPEIVDDPAITLSLAKGVFSSQLAEWIITGIMYWEKFIPTLQAQQKAHLWKRFPIQELRGKTMCVVGFGSIGQEASKRATALGVHVIGVRRRPVPEAEETTTAPKDVAERVVGFEKLMDILPISDYVVNVLPLTAETNGFFSRELFNAMKSTAIFVNLGRGSTVDHNVLLEVLKEHKIAAASIDVADQEPLPPTSPLWDLENIFISPHGAVLTPNATAATREFVKENLTRFAEDKPLLNIAEKKHGY